MDWEPESGGTHFPPPTPGTAEGGQVLLLFFLVLGLIWLAAKVFESVRGRIAAYRSADKVRQRLERRQQLARNQHEKREQAEERKREQRESQVERNRAALEKVRKRRAIVDLAEWYADQRKEIEAALPPGHEREVLLGELFGRYDALLKKTIEELQP